MPSIIPGFNGDLQIEWHVEGIDIELHIIAPNQVKAWHCTPSTGEDGEEQLLEYDFLTALKWVAETVEASSDKAAAA